MIMPPIVKCDFLPSELDDNRAGIPDTTSRSLIANMMPLEP